MSNPYKKYTNNQLDNAAPGEQIAALLEKAAEHIGKASEAIHNHDIQSRYNYSNKAMVILEGLMACLNRETPEMAQAASNLELYYKTMIMLIGRLNIYNDLDTGASIITSLKDMAEFWRSAQSQLYERQNVTLDMKEQSSYFA